jgi:ubiquitin carboxyl-terminal hydrolase 34
VKKENLEDICGDLHAIRIIGQTGGFPNSIKCVLQSSLQSILVRLKDEFNSEG